tara:strand:- start:114 stop:497 length:384 start_codon:yes stop_codon:yes gene_type:complete
MVYKELVALKVVQVVVEQQPLVQLNLVLLEDPVQEDTLEGLVVQEHLMILQGQLSQLLEVVVELLADIIHPLTQVEQVEQVVVELVDLDVVVVEVVWQEQQEQLTLVVEVVEVLMEDQQVQEVQELL